MPKNCPKCGGTGVVIDSVEIGAEMREIRKKKGIQQSFVAGQMGISDPYLSALESGRRQWNDSLVKRFKKAVRFNGR